MPLTWLAEIGVGTYVHAVLLRPGTDLSRAAKREVVLGGEARRRDKLRIRSDERSGADGSATEPAFSCTRVHHIQGALPSNAWDVPQLVWRARGAGAWPEAWAWW